VGPKGSTGATGATGPQGPKGEAASIGAETIQSIVDAAVKAAVEAVKTLNSGTVSTAAGMVSVLGGTLPDGSELKGQVVNDFQIGKTEVSWGDWKIVRDWAVANGYSDLANVGAGIGDNYPVTNVSWYDVVKWSNARSEKEGMTPVYQVSGATYKTGQSVPTLNASANGYRLPSEKEWEWAARGGVSSQGYTYSGSNTISAVGWTYENSSDGTKAVGTKAANELGIYDMSGNVWEWSEDVANTSYRRIRGGSWYYNADFATVAYRDSYFNPAYRSYSFGFRLVRSSGN
jgi:formylglycine-generating enzyme required for sulfatase activity